MRLFGNDDQTKQRCAASCGAVDDRKKGSKLLIAALEQAVHLIWCSADADGKTASAKAEPSIELAGTSVIARGA